MANLKPEYVSSYMEVTSNLFEFSWAAAALLLAGQGWIIAKLYEGDKEFQRWHLIMIFSTAFNIVGMGFLMCWYSSIADEIDNEQINLLSDVIKSSKKLHTYTFALSVLLFCAGFIIWIIYKNKNVDLEKK